MASAVFASSSVPYSLVIVFASLLVASGKPVTLAKSGRRLRTLALADISNSGSHATSAERKSVHAKQVAGGGKGGTRFQDPLPSGWFGDFSQGESTFTKEGLDSSHDDPTWDVKYGRDPSLTPPYSDTELYDSNWFHESESGGPQAAWQTNYPSISASIAGNRDTPENPWRQTPEGWKQDYQTMTASNDHTADWFDNSVHQVDGFGRKMQPDISLGQRYLGWQERSVNTTIACKEPGCTARSSLSLFNTETEEARDCSLSIVIHPTDYDDDFSREHVEFWKVNGYVASRECNPRVRGCNSTAEKPLYPCLNSLNVDRVMDSAGTLVIEGKNSIMVDECPHQNNLLSGVAMATCMVRNKPAAPTKPPADVLNLTVSDLHGKGVLKCTTPGCKAETRLYFSPALALNGGKCTMNISMKQTDYDDALGLPEQIDFIQVEGTNVTTKPVQPGKNPCNMQYKGQNTTESDRVFLALTEYDITDLVKKSKPLGALKISAKNSDQVDECGFDGNLLYGDVTVTCKPPANFSAPPPPAATSLLHEPASAEKANLLQKSAVQKHRGE